MSASLRGGRKYVGTFMLGGIVSSELAWIIRTENKRTDLERKSNAQIAVSGSIIERLKKGEHVDVQKELIGSEEQEDFSKILENLEATDNRWADAKGNTANILKQPITSKPSESEKPKETKGGWL